MTSSTSSFDAVNKSWTPVWILCGLLLTSLLLLWETTVRHAGLGPEYSDNRALWLSSRHELSDFDPASVALLGASRIQRAIEPSVLSQELGRPVVQLAVEGSSGLPVLENLAVDPRFRGTIILSVAPAFSFNRRLSKLDASSQAAWVDAYRRQSRSRRMEQELRLLVQGAFAFRSADAAPPRVLKELADTGRLPQPDYKRIERNRFVHIDPTRFEGNPTPQGVVDLYQQNTEPYERQGFDELLNYFATLVNILQAKGSQVVVVRLPSSGLVLDYEGQLFPKSQFWNRMQQQIDATFVHFEDYPELRGFLSIDGSHIASDRAADFTRELAAVLTDNGTLK
ncbi:MAG: hypothetical protein KJO82_01690 [Gammaproteobacteria bacterium]|nr:hypothetical protein [Gammaproteobacteria bacterium]